MPGAMLSESSFFPKEKESPNEYTTVTLLVCCTLFEYSLFINMIVIKPVGSRRQSHDTSSQSEKKEKDNKNMPLH